MTDKAKLWATRLEACRASGMSTAAYCREYGWSYAQCMYWQRRLAAVPTRGLVPVAVQVPEAPVAAGLTLAISMGPVTLQIKEATVADAIALVRGLAC